MAILGCFRQFWDKKRANPFGFALFGKGLKSESEHFLILDKESFKAFSFY